MPGTLDPRPDLDAPNPSFASIDVLRDVARRNPFTKMLGMDVVSCADGRAVLEMPFRPDMAQHDGLLHGGVVATLADNACCWAAGTAAGYTVTTDLAVTFLAAGKGERFRAIGEVVKASRRLVVCRADIYALRDGRETLIAVAQGTLSKVEAA